MYCITVEDLLEDQLIHLSIYLSTYLSDHSQANEKGPGTHCLSIHRYLPHSKALVRHVLPGIVDNTPYVVMKATCTGTRMKLWSSRMVCWRVWKQGRDGTVCGHYYSMQWIIDRDYWKWRQAQSSKSQSTVMESVKATTYICLCWTDYSVPTFGEWKSKANCVTFLS